MKILIFLLAGVCAHANLISTSPIEERINSQTFENFEKICKDGKFDNGYLKKVFTMSDHIHASIVQNRILEVFQVSCSDLFGLMSKAFANYGNGMPFCF